MYAESCAPECVAVSATVLPWRTPADRKFAPAHIGRPSPHAAPGRYKPSTTYSRENRVRSARLWLDNPDRLSCCRATSACSDRSRYGDSW
ncbi:conserved hypothetical protein [Ricinus communis]|uniref:Uncharacterized protein n=1 Tax=Ricinus communis TaxID=3988 RepID=B9TFR6_RICCO|nr:conserved hypothetical protein [Ricinus communis]